MDYPDFSNNDVEHHIEEMARRMEVTEEIPEHGLGKKIREKFHRLWKIFNLSMREKLILEPYSIEKFGAIVTFKGLNGYIEKERYWVNEPYSFVSILYHEENHEYLYYIAEPVLSSFELMVLETVYENILDTLADYETSKENKIKIMEKKSLELIDSYLIKIEMASLHKILYYIKRDYIGYERIDALTRDPNIEDISCDGSDIPLFVYHRKYQDLETNITFSSEKLDSFVIKLAQRCGKNISFGEPLINSSLPDGSRLNASLGKEITFRGSTFTIRKFREKAFTPGDLIKNHTYTARMLAYLWLAVENGKNIIFAGATAAGKTSTLNAISLFIPPKAKIVSIEDTHELVLHHKNWIGSVTRESFTKNRNINDIDMFELLRQALRQRPEYIIVGEIRGKEGMTLFQAMNTGHTTFSTMHADDVNTVISRLEGEPINIPRVMIQALDLLCIQKIVQLGDKRVRRLDMMIEFSGIDQQSQDLRFNFIYRWNPKNDSFENEGKSFVLESIMKRRDWNEKMLESELDNRQMILEYMAEVEMDEYDASLLLQKYYVDPSNILKFIQNVKKKHE